MPAKKKQAKKKGKRPAGKAAKEAPPEEPGQGEGPTEPVVTEREAQLQAELEQLTLNQETLRKRLDTMRRENVFLQDEAQRVRVESQEYMSYMSKRAQKRENIIISLSDQNKKDLEEIKQQRQELLTHFAEKETELKKELLQKETNFAKLKEETADLQPMKTLQQEQMSRIKELEQEVMATRAYNADTLLKIKGAFLHQKAAYSEDSEQQVALLAKKAQEEADRILKEHNQGVVEENQQLRQELLLLIRRTRILQAHKHHLEMRNKQLIQESKYSQSMERWRRRQNTDSFHQAPRSNGSPTGHQ